MDVHLGIGTITLGDTNTVEVTIHNGADVAGIQFDLSGASIASHSGGLAEQLSSDGWTIAASQNTVIGFDTGGSVTLGPSNGVLMVLEIGTPSEDALCTIDAVMSDSEGEPLVTTTECKPVP